MDGGTWEVGLPTTGPVAARTGANCAATVLGGNYADGVTTRLIRHAAFVVPPADQNPRLIFCGWHSFNCGDWYEVQVKVGEADWFSLIEHGGYGSTTWSQSVFDLRSYAGFSIQVGFLFQSQDCDYPYGPDVDAGWYVDDVIAITGPYRIRIPEDSELGAGDWGSYGGNWDFVMPDFGPASPHSGQYCMATNGHGVYTDFSDGNLASPPFRVAAATLNPRLGFWHWFDFNCGDYGQMKIKIGASDWADLPGHYSASSSNAWTWESIDLAFCADSMVQVGFQFHSQDCDYPYGWDAAAGWFVDDVFLPSDSALSTDPSEFPLTPRSFALLQNYPNPFNLLTQVRFDLPYSTHARLSIFDLQGRLVESLFSQWTQAGSRVVTFNARGLASGIYFARLDAGGITQTRKMILLK